MTTASDAPADNSSAPLLLAIEPTVFVTDLPRSLAFYVETLGFEVALTYGEPPFFGVVARDAASLNLRLAPQPAIDRSQGPDLLSASITVSHARQLFLEFQGRGAPSTRCSAASRGTGRARASSSSPIPTAICCCSAAAPTNRGLILRVASCMCPPF